MKNNTYKKFSTLATIFVLLYTLFTLAYGIFGSNSVPYLIIQSRSYPSTNLILIAIIKILKFVASILLLIGVIKKNKSITIASFIMSIIAIFLNSIYYCITNSFHTFLIDNLWGYNSSDLSYLLFNLALMFFILTLFKMSESTNETNVNKPQINSVKTVSPDITNTLLEYKDLLDIGAITQEEFESKKRELLNL